MSALSCVSSLIAFANMLQKLEEKGKHDDIYINCALISIVQILQYIKYESVYNI